MIRKDAWPFNRTSSGVRLCWVSKNLKDLKDQVGRRPPLFHRGELSPPRILTRQKDLYFIAEQPPPTPRCAHPERCAALRIVLVNVPRVSHSCQHFLDGFEPHLLYLEQILRGYLEQEIHLEHPCGHHRPAEIAYVIIHIVARPHVHSGTHGTVGYHHSRANESSTKSH